MTFWYQEFICKGFDKLVVYIEIANKLNISFQEQRIHLVDPLLQEVIGSSPFAFHSIGFQPVAGNLMTHMKLAKSTVILCISSWTLLQFPKAEPCFASPAQEACCKFVKSDPFMIGYWTGSELKAFLFSMFTVYRFPLHLMGDSVLLFCIFNLKLLCRWILTKTIDIACFRWVNMWAIDARLLQFIDKDLLLGNYNVCSQCGGVYQVGTRPVNALLSYKHTTACLLALTTADQTPGSLGFCSSITCQVLFAILKQCSV